MTARVARDVALVMSTTEEATGVEADLKCESAKKDSERLRYFRERAFNLSTKISIYRPIYPTPPFMHSFAWSVLPRWARRPRHRPHHLGGLLPHLHPRVPTVTHPSSTCQWGQPACLPAPPHVWVACGARTTSTTTTPTAPPPSPGGHPAHCHGNQRRAAGGLCAAADG